ncbi:hypothetical protein C8R43DRAFT_956149 [Mycena crocata]|nr:hypothetical protein C8R43DRAFT_956149 [Mycena crocata]
MDSPYQDILYTNTIPSDEECQRIRDIIATPMQELSNVTTEMSRLKIRLDQLADKRDQLTEFIDSHLALVSMARKVPHDIVREIFNAALPENGNLTSLIDSPLQFTHICRDWRHLALSMPELWTSIHVVGDPEPDDPLNYARRFNEGMKAWLPRSGGLPLTISIHWPTGDCSALFETLMKTSRRWLHIHFIIPSYSYLSPLGALSRDDVPLLRTVVIDVGIPSSPSEYKFLSFLGAPNILRASIKRSGGSFQHSFNWEELRHVSIGRDIRDSDDIAGSLGTAFPALWRSSKLETFTMPIYSMGDTLTNPLRLALLRRLSIIDCTTRVQNVAYYRPTTFFQQTELPKLRHLEYISFNYHPAALSFLSALNAPRKLTTLCLSLPLSRTSLSDGLRLLPMLKELVIHRSGRLLGYQPNCELFTLLTTPSSLGELLCPELQKVCSLGQEVGTDQQLLQMIQARSHTLSSVHVVFPRDREVDIIPQLQPIIVTGLHIQLCYITAEFDREAANFNFLKVYGDSGRPSRPEEHWEPISEVWKAEYSEWGRPAGQIRDL